MADNDQHTPFYRDPIKVLTTLSITVATVIGGKQIYDELIKQPPPTIAVEYVIVASHAMRGRIAKEQKLNLVRDNVVGAVGRQTDKRSRSASEVEIAIPTPIASHRWASARTTETVSMPP